MANVIDLKAARVRMVTGKLQPPRETAYPVLGPDRVVVGESETGRPAGGRRLEGGRANALGLLRDRHLALHRAAAGLNAAGQLSDDDVIRLRWLYKHAGRARRWTVPRIRSLVSVLDKERGEMEKRMEVMAPPAPATLNGHPDVTAKEEFDAWSDRITVATLMERGYTPAEALQVAGSSRTTKWAKQVSKKYKAGGIEALVDGRRHNRGAVKVMSQEVKDLIRGQYHAMPAACYTSVAKAVAEVCEKRGLRAPCYESVRLFLAELTKMEQKSRGGMRGDHARRTEAVVRLTRGDAGNDQWNVDHTTLDLWIRVWSGGRWEPVKPTLTAIVDEYSRVVPGFVLSPSSASTVALHDVMMVAMLPTAPVPDIQGLPWLIRSDRGSEFMSNAFRISLRKLGIVSELSAPNYPNNNGKVERWFQTLDKGLLRTLPGHTLAIGKSKGAAEKRVGELMALNQVEALIRRWIVDVYHTARHSELDDAPIQVWTRTARIRSISKPKLQEALLRADQVRTIQQDGVQMTHDGEKYTYWAPPFASLVGEKVRLAYHPDEVERVLVYGLMDNRYICDAFAMGFKTSPYGIKDVQEARTQVRREMKKQISELISHLPEPDEPWEATEDAANEKAAELLASVEVDEAEETMSEEDALLAAYEESFRKRTTEMNR